jgi:hypothetical protein
VYMIVCACVYMSVCVVTVCVNVCVYVVLCSHMRSIWVCVRAIDVCVHGAEVMQAVCVCVCVCGYAINSVQ